MMELEGTTVNGRYEVVRRLQSGYYGTTWLATDKANGQEVCLKVILISWNQGRLKGPASNSGHFIS